MVKHLVTSFLACFLFLAFPLVSFAHVGGGPPFVKVNDKYSPNDYYYQGPSAITVPQDLAPETYLPNKQVTFTVDINKLVNQLSITTEFINTLTFRWSVYQGQNLDQQLGGYQY